MPAMDASAGVVEETITVAVAAQCRQCRISGMRRSSEPARRRARSGDSFAFTLTPSLHAAGGPIAGRAPAGYQRKYQELSFNRCLLTSRARVRSRRRPAESTMLRRCARWRTPSGSLCSRRWAEASPFNATEAAEIIGESPSACSFHFRMLAKYGLVEDARRRHRAAEAVAPRQPGRLQLSCRQR